MRAALLPAWPLLSELYGIHPWDVYRLSGAELRRYQHAIQDRIDATGGR